MLNRKTLLAGVVAIAVVLVFAVLVVRLDEQSRRRNVAEAPAEIMELERTSQRRGSNRPRRETTRVHYRYWLDGGAIDDTTTADGNWSVGERAKVCYDPSDPQRHRLEKATYECGS